MYPTILYLTVRNILQTIKMVTEKRNLKSFNNHYKKKSCTGLTSRTTL